jgi:hypothetical protein
MSAIPPKADMSAISAALIAVAASALEPVQSGPGFVSAWDLGFDESGKGEDVHSHLLNPDLSQNWLELLAETGKGRSRSPNINHAPAARHRSRDVRKQTLHRPVRELVFSPF